MRFIESRLPKTVENKKIEAPAKSNGLEPLERFEWSSTRKPLNYHIVFCPHHFHDDRKTQGKTSVFHGLLQHTRQYFVFVCFINKKVTNGYL